VSAVAIRAYTDPGCPSAFAAEGVRLRLLWRYGDQIAWEPRMSILREQRGEEWPAAGADATVYACLAVVAAGQQWPDRRDAFLRRLRVLAMAGEMLDDSDTLEIAAEQAGLPVAEMAAFCAEPEVAAALRSQAEGAPPSPTYEIVAGDATVRLRGLPAVQTAEAALAELDLAPRGDPATADDVMAWAQMPLTDAEIAAVCAKD
jgi:hypothetical protein